MSSPIRGENDNSRGGPTDFGASRLSLFFPVLVIAGGCGLLLLLSQATGEPDGTMVRLCLLLLFVAVPLMAAYAGLRAATIAVHLQPHALVLARGFPARHPVAVAWHDIASVRVRRRPLAGGRTLIVEDVQGTRTMVHDLRGADQAAALIRARIGRFQGVAALLDGLSAMGRRGIG